jgi:hypothetical protein
MNLLSGGLLGSGRWGRNSGGELGLEFADGALEFGELLGVFVGEIVQLFAKLGVLEIQRNEKGRRGEQRQPIEHVQ